MRQVKELWFPFLVVVVPAVLFSSLLPFFPVDETRYLSVAWEMKLYNSFIVPLQNALPYSHKPPLLFWLLNLDWLLFGVNELSLRAIPLLFSLLNITLVHRIALQLWDDEKTARTAAVILSSTLSYLLWSVVIMFDVVLTFWILLALSALLAAARGGSGRQWIVMGLAMGGGLLTKGPVTFLYVLPAALLSFLWIPKEGRPRQWYGRLALATLLGIAVILLWVVPAVMSGGESYRRAILWGQTVNRMADAFAHKRPFWWYLPWVPALLVPWVLLVPAWRGCWRAGGDLGSRFLAIWAGCALLILSLVSSKQVHYLIPVLPAFSLLLARNLEARSDAGESSNWRYAIGGFYALAGAAILALPLLKRAPFVEQFGVAGLRALGCGVVIIGVTLLVLKRPSLTWLVNQVALSSVALLAVVTVTGGGLFQRYDLHPISSEVKTRQEQGYTVLHYGKYHGQFQFLGRLRQPLLSTEDLREISRVTASHDKVAMITYEPWGRPVSREESFFRQPFRSRQVVLWNKKGIDEFLRQRGGATQASAAP